MNFSKRIGFILLLGLVLSLFPASGQAVLPPKERLYENLVMLEEELLNSKRLLTQQQNTLNTLKQDLETSETIIKDLERSITNLETHISELEKALGILRELLADSYDQTITVSNSLQSAEKSLKKSKTGNVILGIVGLVFGGLMIYAFAS